jgi:hypothetical protein
MLSSIVKRSDYAVGLVPLMILPQILFSEVAIDKDSFAGVSQWLYKIMPSRWGYESMLEFAQTEVDYGDALLGFPMLIVLSALFLGVAVPCLKLQRY